MQLPCFEYKTVSFLFGQIIQSDTKLAQISLGDSDPNHLACVRWATRTK